SRGRYSFVARMGVTFSLLQLLPRPFFPPPNGATRNVEQINAFDSRCDHQHPSCKSSLWSVSTGSTVSRRRTQFTVLREVYQMESGFPSFGPVQTPPGLAEGTQIDERETFPSSCSTKSATYLVHLF